MTLVVSPSAGNYSYENFNETKKDAIERLPDELVLEVFCLDLATLGTICRVSKAWERVGKKPILWRTAIYREIAFGNDKWAQYFGKDVVKGENKELEFSSLPLDEFIADCKKFKRIFPKINAKDNLMLVRLPKTLNGELTLKNLGELAKMYFLDSDTGYGYICPLIDEELGNKSIDKSRWVMMTRRVLPGSRYESYLEQQQIVADLAEKSLTNYEVPEILEAVACIFAQYFDSKRPLFDGTHTRCKEKVQGRTIGVGGSEFGPTVPQLPFDHKDNGVTALRRFEEPVQNLIKRV